ncbi:MAG: BtpA/SgcQ family protein [Longicatena sp.]
MENKNFLSIFQNEKPVFGMLHLKGSTHDEIFEKAKNEIDLYIEGGVDAIIVENYFGNYYDMENILQYLLDAKKDIIYGVNCLHVDPMGFYLAKKYCASFVQLDSVCGHLKVRDDPGFDEFIKLCRKGYDGYILGGVRFKYQPYKSGRTLEEDLNIGKTRCDAIVVTQDATGQETSLDKIEKFRKILGDFPLVIGAGMTPDNCEKQLELADAAIVGSYFKDTYKDDGDLDLSHIQDMVHALNNIRKKKGV